MHTPDELVGIDLGKAARLAVALTAAADDLEGRRSEVVALLTEVGVGLAPVRALQETADWCRRERVALDTVIAALERLERLAPETPAIWRSAGHPSFDAPRRAHEAAGRAASAGRAGDARRMHQLVGRWADDPVFAATFLSLVGPDGVLAALLRFAAAGETDGPASRERQRTVEGLAHVMSTAAAGSGAPFGVAEIVAAAGGDPFALGAIGLLAAGRHARSSSLLVELVDDYLLHLNALVRRGTVTAHSLRVHVDGEDVDPRVLVLRAVTADRVAATAAFTAGPGPEGTRLDLLLPEWTAYGDDGAALGEAMVVGTAPAGDPRATTAAFLDVVRWIAAHEELPAAAHDALGRVAAPYLGSFRPDHLAAGRVADPAPALAERDAARFLAFAARRALAEDAIRLAGLQWAIDQTDLLGAAAGGGDGQNEIGGVLGLVDKARAMGALRRSLDHDAARDAERAVVGGALAVLGSVPSPKVALPATAASLTIDAWLPPTTSAATRALRIPRDFAAGQVAAELVLLAALWRHRTHNHLWEQAGGPVPPPPPAALLEPLGRGADATERLEVFLRWKEQPSVASTAVGRLLDDLGASYGESGALGP